jgi:hypothetical protein
MKIPTLKQCWDIFFIVIVFGGCAYMFVTGMAKTLSQDTRYKPGSIEHRIQILQEQRLMQEVRGHETAK